ncbi:chromosomal replication initiator DnaA [Roseomonas stagni]|uniref:Chromosomal replication initiator DnaA n=1 Tax=Falsiroseomonas algicola TaxID=2716930 RepID=A0A6M1LU63_9PROT|nr:chromosomal replication initiator DnaA [Falsiroseomonas algicola]NGM23549.1 chromosomal replication initiator DnaA [Falsiroseomonas algicola]
MLPPTQLPLPLARPPSSARADWVPDASNAEALAWLADPVPWPLHRLALFGPAGTGKTHLLRIAAADHGWRLMEGAALTPDLALAPAPGTALDAADQADQEALFHLINQAAATGAPLLMAARLPPARWPTTLPDLASRLRATHAVALHEPSDTLLAALLAKHLADRQLRLDAAVQAWLLARLPRDAASLAAAIATLDEAALAHSAPITRPFARQVLGARLGLEDAEDDRFGNDPPETSPEGPVPG